MNMLSNRNSKNLIIMISLLAVPLTFYFSYLSDDLDDSYKTLYATVKKFVSSDDDANQVDSLSKKQLLEETERELFKFKIHNTEDENIYFHNIKLAYINEFELQNAYNGIKDAKRRLFSSIIFVPCLIIGIAILFPILSFFKKLKVYKWVLKHKDESKIVNFITRLFSTD